MSSPAWIKGLREIAKKRFSKGDIDSIMDDMIAEKNDRGAALLGAALIEAILERVVEKFMISLNSDLADDMFGSSGTLRSFSSKIRIAFALGIIDRTIYSDLQRMREIRNVFAHTTTGISFTTKEIGDACAGFSAAAIAPHEGLPWPQNHPRHQYTSTLGLLAVTIAKAGRKGRPHQPSSYEP